MRQDGWVVRHLWGRLPIVLPMLLIVLVAMTVIIVPDPPQASAAVSVDIEVTCPWMDDSGTIYETLWLDANNAVGDGPRGQWVSFIITNTGDEDLKDLTITMGSFTGAEASLFIDTADPERYFTTLAVGESVPVYFYVDYQYVMLEKKVYGHTADYTLTVTGTGVTSGDPLSVVDNRHVYTDSLIEANAAGLCWGVVLGPGVYVGQIYTQENSYEFGNNTNLFFMPAGEADFMDHVYRLVASEITFVETTAATVTGIAVGDQDRLYFPGSEIKDNTKDATITVKFTWEVVSTSATGQAVNPWAAAISGNQTKYAGFNDTLSTELPIPGDPDGALTVTKTVDPVWLPTSTSNAGYGPGIVKYTVVFTNPVIDVDLKLASIKDTLPTGLTMDDPFYTEGVGYVTEAKSASYPGYSGAPVSGEVEWMAVSGRPEDTEYIVPAAQDINDNGVFDAGVDIAGTLTLEYLADASGLAPDPAYTNTVVGYVRDLNGSTTVGPVNDTFGIGDPTLAVVGSFEAYKSGGKVVLNWDTASEIGTAGFYLERLNEKSGEWTRVNTDIVPALLESPTGGTYTLVDTDAKPGNKLTYRLVELESSGNTRTYGPYEVKAQVALPSSLGAADIAQGEMSVRIPKSVTTTAGQQGAESSGRVVGRENASVDRMRIEVVDAGLYVVTASEIAAGLDLKEDKAAKLVADGGLELTSQGEQVAYLPADDGSKLYFYGESIDGIYAATNVYWLSKGDGETIAAQSDTATGGAASITSFMDTMHLEQDLIGAPALFHDPEGDFWLWKYMFAGYAGLDKVTLDLDAPDVVGGGTLGVRLQGYNTKDIANEHLVQVSLNGVVLGQTTWSGKTANAASFSVPAGVLQTGHNALEVKALRRSSAVVSMVLLDSVDLTYERATTAVSDELLLTAPGSGLARVDGLSSTDAWVFDLSRPELPDLLPIVDSGGEAGAAWLSFDIEQGGTYLVCNEANALQPAAMAATSSTALQRNMRSDYVIITDTALVDAAQALADYRAEQGLKATVVTLNDIYDEFNYGLADPHAIQAFLRNAYHSWQPGPRYVVLAGEGSYDFKNVMGYGDCVVPSLLVDTEWGLATSDVLLGDVVGSDGVPEISIGRLVVLNEDELTAAIAKIKGYEAATGAWRSSVLLAADNSDNGGDFPADSDGLAALLPPSLTVDKAYIDGTPASTAVAKAKIKNAFNSGALWVNYVGHGGIGQLAGEGVLTYLDAATLTSNGFQLPLVSIFSCMAGAYWVPGAAGLSETLVRLPTAGAIAVWAPSAMEFNIDSVALANVFTQGMFGSPGTVVLGEQILATQRNAAAAGVPVSVIDTYNLLGDPALRISW